MKLLTSAAVVVVVVVEPVIALAFVARRAAGRRRRALNSDDRDGERDETVGTVCALRKACVRMALAAILMVDRGEEN